MIFKLGQVFGRAPDAEEESVSEAESQSQDEETGLANNRVTIADNDCVAKESLSNLTVRI